MVSVRTSIFGRPRRLPGERRAADRYTLICEEPLYRAVAALPEVASIKIPGVPAEPAAAAGRVRQLRQVLPEHVAIGVSGDAFGATGLNAGCDGWYSVLGGTLPDPVLRITRAAQAGDAREAAGLSARLQPLWELFGQHGSLRVTAAIAEHLGLVASPSLPLPIRGLDAAARRELAGIVTELQLDP